MDVQSRGPRFKELHLSVTSMNQVPGEIVLFLGNIFLYLPVIQYLKNVTDELKHSTYTYSEGQGFSNTLRKKKKKGWILLFWCHYFL